MARIAGVTTQKDTKGNVTHVTINIKKHKEAVPVLQDLGLLEKSDFMKEFENAVPFEEAREHSLKHVRSLWNK